MLIGIETTPVTKLTYFPTKKQAKRWKKKHPGCDIWIVPDNCKPTKIDLTDIWSRNNKLSRVECQLIWYEKKRIDYFDDPD